MSRPYLSTLALAGLLAASPALAQDEPGIDTVLATVGDTEITLGHAIAARATLPDQFDRLPPQDLFDGVVRQLVLQEQITQDSEGELSKVARLRLENERRAITAEDRINRMTADVVTEKALRQAYEAQYQGDGQRTEYRAAHILVETREKADRLAAEIADGANFAALAQDHSLGPSGASGGKLDWFGEGVMVDDFFAAVTALDEGEVSEPVQTKFGWHLIKLDETRTQATPEFGAVRDALAEKVRTDAVDRYRATLNDAIAVDVVGDEAVPPEMINRTDLLEN